MAKKWFKEAVMKKPPYRLGWKKTQSLKTRRRKALASRPETMKLKTKYLSTARALQSLANVTKDKRTRELAGRDARHFLRKYHGR